MRLTLKAMAGCLAVTLLLGCRISTPPSLRECSSIADTYFYDGELLDVSATLRSFPTYELDTQYQIYLCATQYMRPAMLEFRIAFAAGGNRSAEYLTTKLREGGDAASTLGALEAVADMQRQNSYDVRNDRELLSLLRQRVLQLESSSREYAEEILERIESSQSRT